jgi:hypothetical protein
MLGNRVSVSELGYNLRYKLGYTDVGKSKKHNEIKLMSTSSLRSERTKALSEPRPQGIEQQQ